MVDGPGDLFFYLILQVLFDEGDHGVLTSSLGSHIDFDAHVRIFPCEGKVEVLDSMEGEMNLAKLAFVYLIRASTKHSPYD